MLLGAGGTNEPDELLRFVSGDGYGFAASMIGVGTEARSRRV